MSMMLGNAKMHVVVVSSSYPTTKTPTPPGVSSSSSSCKVLLGGFPIYSKAAGKTSSSSITTAVVLSSNNKHESSRVPFKWSIDPRHGVPSPVFALNRKAGSNLRMLEGQNYPKQDTNYQATIVESAMFAIDQHNKQHKTNYELSRIVAARSLMHRGPMVVIVLDLKIDHKDDMCDLYLLELNYYVRTPRKILDFRPLTDCERQALHWMISDDHDDDSTAVLSNNNKHESSSSSSSVPYKWDIDDGFRYKDSRF